MWWIGNWRERLRSWYWKCSIEKTRNTGYGVLNWMFIYPWRHVGAGFDLDVRERELPETASSDVLANPLTSTPFLKNLDRVSNLQCKRLWIVRVRNSSHDSLIKHTRLAIVVSRRIITNVVWSRSRCSNWWNRRRCLSCWSTCIDTVRVGVIRILEERVVKKSANLKNKNQWI